MKSINNLLEHVTLDDIYRFMQTGSADNAPAEVVEYLKVLEQTNGMINRFDVFASKNAVIKHLMITKEVSKYKAEQIYYDTIEYFYRDERVSEEALRNFYAKKADEILNFTIKIMETATDAKKAIEIIKEIWTFRGLYETKDDEVDPSELSPKMYIYEADPIKAGLPAKVDRNKVKNWINKNLPQLSEAEKNRIFQEADIIPFEIFPAHASDPRKT